jgi:hypothetical protein
MKTALMCIVCLTLGSLPSTGAPGDTLFAYRDTDAAYLRYLASVNSFDDASVMYTVGELELVGPSGIRRVVFDDSALAASEGVTDPNTQGIQSLLLPFARSRTFTLASNETTIRFFRSLSMTNVDTLLRRTASWRSSDRTEYVLRLVRASDDSVLAIVDSVGFDSTLTMSDTVSAYGPNVSVWCRAHSVDAVHRGVPVYLQLVPKRWGPTPHALTLVSVQRPFSESVYYDCGMSAPDSARWSALRARLLERFMQYAAAMWSSECKVPVPPAITLPPGFMETYADLYYDVVVHENNNILVLKDCDRAKRPPQPAPSGPRPERFDVKQK